jgi:hypothetical protein
MLKNRVKIAKKIQIRTFYNTDALKVDNNQSNLQELDDNDRLDRVRERFNNANTELSNCENRIAEFRSQYPEEIIPSVLRNNLQAAQEELEDATLELDYESVYGEYENESLSNESNEEDQEDESQNQDINIDNKEKGIKRSRSFDTTESSEGPKGPKRPKGPEDPKDGTEGAGSTVPSKTGTDNGITNFIQDLDEIFINLHEIFLVFYNLNSVPLFILALFIKTCLFFNSFKGRFCLWIFYVNLSSSYYLYKIKSFYN